MSKTTKRLTCTLFVIVAILIAGGITLKLSLSTENIQSFVSKQISENTGRKLNIKGAIAWRLFPSIRLELNQVSLTNPKQSKDEVSAKKIVVGVKLLPLIKKQIEPTELTINDLSYQDEEQHQVTIEKVNLSGSQLKLNQNFPIDIRLN